ncbi:MAG: IclR family transcriptional regulator [Desulfobacterales bacterium]|nr:IclR family transcriptional regulator [Desulfobacterales bacterium]
MADKEYFMINSIVKTIRLIEELVKRKEFDLVELTRRLEYPKTTVHRMLLTLKSLDYVKQNESNKQYGATIKLFQLGHRFLENNDLFKTAQPIIEELSEEIGESVYVLERDNLDVVVTARATSSYSLRQDEQIGFRYKTYNSAGGRTILANLSLAERRRLFRGHKMEPCTPKSPTSYSQLESMLAEILHQGHAVEHEEYGIGISGVAAPIFDHMGCVSASVTITGATARMRPKVFDLIQKVKKASEKISTGIGFKNNESFEVRN